ncbi:MAG: polyhydroxyalkanoate synthesis regulator DNA-binding domain-containing protein [Pseudomonadota bacterium]|jgi:polyhydroxyalkanoate synthesis repressor PhaR|nr:transcriptional regulator [Syntrophaceae bacterium]MDI9555994.1 polyhydroxyalkanoate synthesis regulator DNA-binding domain-containing protein [Pseudomonadota bacterium]NLX30276.1 transcriptional regulator [Deltaproteobacteria bacterium]HNU84822.1 polyhydroxyalkanoate synthesis regulator DNA-binding domain-containing protein [Syntrophales bacterium]HNZ34038.1 polyhydroxyalkanoate synthesis regulator DNA-binding domain-containing protein [Syntrophales bacterium]
MADRVVIKKYNNRRLYDTEKNAYVTLAALAETIKKGRQIEVIDAQTKEDVTAFTLTQIVLEEAKSKQFLLPVPLLHLMIRFGETVLSEFFEKYLQQVVRNYLAYKTSVDAQFAKWLDLGAQLSQQAPQIAPPLNPFLGVLDMFPKAPMERPRAEKKKEE